MKIALLTIWHEYNYGAELQAYATIRILQEMGHEVEMIDLRLSDFVEKNIYGKIARFITIFSPGERKFQQFWHTNIPRTKRYVSMEMLEKDPPKADIYMVGSDQVWNPAITQKIYAAFFLNFGEKNIKRVSYASSFGYDTWRYPEYIDIIRPLLNRFTVISCREESGVSILEHVFGISEVQCVVDPTLLLEDYSALIGNHIKKTETLVYYPLGKDDELECFSHNLAKELHLEPINSVNPQYICRKKILWDRASVAEWIRYIAQAQFVVTRSFHGMVFSILHKQNFAVVLSPNGRSTRITNLLMKLGIMDRVYPSFTALYSDRPWQRDINYDDVYQRLQIIRNDSKRLIENMLMA